MEHNQIEVHEHNPYTVRKSQDRRWIKVKKKKETEAKFKSNRIRHEEQQHKLYKR